MYFLHCQSSPVKPLLTGSSIIISNRPFHQSKVKPVPIPKTLLLVNNFVSSTTSFLNHFSNLCEEKLIYISEKVTELEIMLAMLEAKLRSIPQLCEAFEEAQVEGEVLQQEEAKMPGLPPPLPSQELASTPPSSTSSAAQPRSTQEEGGMMMLTKNEDNDDVGAPAMPAGMTAANEHPDYMTFFKMVRITEWCAQSSNGNGEDSRWL